MPADRQVKHRGYARIPAAVILGEALKAASGTAIKVLLAIVVRINRRRATAHPSRRRLALDSGLSLSRVDRGLHELRDLGLLRWESAQRRGCRRTNTYTLPWLQPNSVTSDAIRSGGNSVTSDPLRRTEWHRRRRSNSVTGDGRIASPATTRTINSEPDVLNQGAAAGAAASSEGQQRAQQPTGAANDAPAGAGAATLDALLAAGVYHAIADRLAGTPGITLEVVQAEARRCREKGLTPGALVRVLEARGRKAEAEAVEDAEAQAQRNQRRERSAADRVARLAAVVDLAAPEERTRLVGYFGNVDLAAAIAGHRPEFMTAGELNRLEDRQLLDTILRRLPDRAGVAT